MRVSGSLSSSLVLCGHVQGITAPGSLWACPNVQRRVTLLGMAGLSLYFPIPVESYLQGTKSQNWPRILGKEMIHGGDQGPRSGPKPQGSRGLSPYGQFSLAPSLLVREPGTYMVRKKRPGPLLVIPGLMGKQDAPIYNHSLLQMTLHPTFPSVKWVLLGPHG